MLFSSKYQRNKAENKRTKKVIVFIVFGCPLRTNLSTIYNDYKNLNLPTILIFYDQILFKIDFIPTHNWLPSYVAYTFLRILI
jgi:hypothetical protein